MSSKGVPVFISSVEEIGRYLVANCLTGEMLTSEETREKRSSIESLLSRITGRDRNVITTRLRSDVSGHKVYSHFMWDVIPDKYSEFVPRRIEASDKDRLCLVFEDPTLPAVSLDQGSLVVEDLTDADLYITPYASSAWLFVLTHEPIGPFFIE